MVISTSPLYNGLIGDLKRYAKMFMDQTIILAPAKPKQDTSGPLARDDRPLGGGAPPKRNLAYTPGWGMVRTT